MTPDITFHGIASIRFDEIENFPATEKHNHAFSTRNLILTDAEGNTFRIGLYAETEAALFVSAKRHWKPEPYVMEEGKLLDVPPALDPKTGRLIPW